MESRTTDDATLVREHLAAYRRAYSDAPWTRSPEDDEYVAAVVDRIAELRASYKGDGMFLAPTHIDETGFCQECDARRIFNERD